MKEMADAGGNLENGSSLYHSSVRYNWKIVIVGMDYFFIDEAGLCSNGHTQHNWDKISRSEAVVMKKADLAWGRLSDSRQKGEIRSYSKKA